MIDVAALAVAQIRAARRAFEARQSWIAAQDAWRQGAPYDVEARRAYDGARRALVAADRAYEQACGEALADTAAGGGGQQEAGVVTTGCVVVIPVRHQTNVWEYDRPSMAAIPAVESGPMWPRPTAHDDGGAA